MQTTKWSSYDRASAPVRRAYDTLAEACQYGTEAHPWTLAVLVDLERAVIAHEQARHAADGFARAAEAQAAGDWPRRGMA